MTQILAFIAKYMGFLWDRGWFRIVGSETNGWDALLFVESDVLRLRFARDRGQLILELQPVSGSSDSEWFSVDLIRRLVFGKRESSGLLDQGYAEFLSQYLKTIETRFQGDQWVATHAELSALKAQRSRELFG